MTYRDQIIKELEKIRWEVGKSQFSNTQQNMVDRVADWHLQKIKEAIEEYKVVYLCDCDRNDYHGPVVEVQQ